jgi:hypothetical protein
MEFDNQNEKKSINPNNDDLDYNLDDSEPFKEKPYYMQEDGKNMKYVGKNNIIEKCFNRYDELNKYFLKIFSLLLIQYISIIFFTFVGFYFSLNLFFIQTTNSMLWTAGPVTILISFLCYGILKIEGYNRKNKLLYIYLGVYIPCIVLYCFLLSNYTETSYIMLVLFIISLDFFGILLYIIIFTIKDYKFLIVPVITSTAMLLIFHYRWDLTPVITIKISSVVLSAIIYIGLMSSICKNKIKEEYYIFATIIFNLTLFAPVAVIVFLVLAFILFILTHKTEEEKKKKKY